MHPGLRKVVLAARIWRRWAQVRLGLARHRLPVLVGRLGTVERTRRLDLPPGRLGHAVHRALAVGPLRPRCLVSSLVLYRLLREAGLPAELVIGLPLRAAGKEAHAWVELEGVEVGPPPGRSGHVELARYGRRSTTVPPPA